MKGTAFVFITLIFGLLVVAGCVSSTESKGPVPVTVTLHEVRPTFIVGVDGDFPPFSTKDQSGNYSGFDIDAARWIAEREGFEVKFIAVPWDRIVPALESGEIDMVYSGMSVTDERQARVNFSQPYYAVNRSVAVRAGSPLTMDDLYNGRLRIGAQTGSTEADWVTKNLIQNGKMTASNLTQYADITTLTNNLESGMVDASLIQTPSQKRAIAGRPLVIIGTTPSQEMYAVAVRKSDTELQAMIDDGLMQLMQDPSWHQLKMKYDMEE